MAHTALVGAAVTAVGQSSLPDPSSAPGLSLLSQGFGDRGSCLVAELPSPEPFANLKDDLPESLSL